MTKTLKRQFWNIVAGTRKLRLKGYSWTEIEKIYLETGQHNTGTIQQAIAHAKTTWTEPLE